MFSLKRFISWEYRKSKALPIDVIPPAPVAEEPKELSCFVKGIIKSLNESPEDWSSCYEMPNYCSYRHKSGLNISYYHYNNSQDNSQNFVYKFMYGDLNFSNFETKSLTQAIWNHQDYCKKLHKKMQKERIKKEMEQFEKLGCPFNES